MVLHFNHIYKTAFGSWVQCIHLHELSTCVCEKEQYLLIYRIGSTSFSRKQYSNVVCTNGKISIKNRPSKPCIYLPSENHPYSPCTTNSMLFIFGYFFENCTNIGDIEGAQISVPLAYFNYAKQILLGQLICIC